MSELKGIGDRLQNLEETHVKVRKALCAAAGVYPWSSLGQTCDVFGTLQSVPCRARIKELQLRKLGVASIPYPLLRADCRGQREM